MCYSCYCWSSWPGLIGIFTSLAWDERWKTFCRIAVRPGAYKWEHRTASVWLEKLEPPARTWQKLSQGTQTPQVLLFKHMFKQWQTPQCALPTTQLTSTLFAGVSTIAVTCMSDHITVRPGTSLGSSLAKLSMFKEVSGFYHIWKYSVTKCDCVSVVDQDYSVTVGDVVAVKGNTAVLRCVIPAQVREHVRVTSWLHEEGTAIEIFPEKV